MIRASYKFIFLLMNLGDSCSVRGAPGVCKDVSQCPSALADIRKRINPQICSFNNDISVVCCVDKAANAALPTVTTTTQRPPAATTNPPKKESSTTEYTPEYNDYALADEIPECAPLPESFTAPKTGQKAWDKCVEYQAQYVYPCQDSVALTGGRVRGNNCKHNANKLIINGEDAGTDEFPHMALLGYGEENAIIFQCGGSIISESFILTAGHCTYARIVGSVTFALVGTLRRSDHYDKDKLYGIHRIHKPIDYAPPMRYNDIALLETDRRIKLSAFAIPACLDLSGQLPEVAVATGWGELVNRSFADTLQKIELPKHSDEECVRRVGIERTLKTGIDNRTQVCYGNVIESRDTCQGDSGGPLQINSAHIKCMYVIVGVTSFGRQCGVIGEPGVYTRVQPFVSWIESIVWP